MRGIPGVVAYIPASALTVAAGLYGRGIALHRTRGKSNANVGASSDSHAGDSPAAAPDVPSVKPC